MKEMVDEEGFKPLVRLNHLSGPPSTQNLSQNTDGSAFAH